MTPTLFGRWQTRLLLLATVGVLVTLLFSLGIIGPGASFVYFYILVYVALFGLVWDILYNFLQQFRWDHDWPGAYQLFAGIWELVFVAAGVKGFLPLPADVARDKLPLGWVVVHYTLVWLGVYIASQSLMRILFPRSRFRGGQWL